MPCLRHRSLADIPAACSFSTLMICSSVNLPLRIVRLLGGEQNPNSKPRAFQGSRSRSATLNGTTDIALTFADYITAENQDARRFEQLSDETKKFIAEVEDVANAPVSLI